MQINGTIIFLVLPISMKSKTLKFIRCEFIIMARLQNNEEMNILIIDLNPNDYD